MSLKQKINANQLPQHIAIIMDGNGRWANIKGKLRVFGHQNGVRPIRKVSEAAAELGIGYVTLYAFSTENWNRPEKEVKALMELLRKTIPQELPTLMKNNIRLNAIGDLKRLPEQNYKALMDAMKETETNTGLVLTLALSYSSRWEIVEAVKKITSEIQQGNYTAEAIDEKLFGAHLSTATMPDPDLLIRTSGEWRISNYMLWQIAYSELYFTDKFWPDFGKEDLYKAILAYQNRERRFGKTSDQLTTSSNKK
ncbi:MAG: isoprenyl transferase [Lentimicrobiaceae bacterium]|jgi:undecaprenyl diphosphate synthase|nr:isoprenyl transferase [Lentimicrobiaceae bacterium]